MKSAVVASAVNNGQRLGVGELCRRSGLASTTVVQSNWRLSDARPLIALSSPSQSGSRPDTTGTKAKLYEAGGEVVAHSRPDASHGLSPAGWPRRKVSATL